MKDNRRYWGVLTPQPATNLAQAVKEAEGFGLEGLWVAQIYSPPFTTLAAAAMASQRLKLGTGVALAFVRSPLKPRSAPSASTSSAAGALCSGSARACDG